ncbi:MAG TPA: hypothetical protein VFO10_17780, partial [Oligoflexus sp.]|uniref:WD40/YVTN/BNR-like repeat-containing protein n=1 Tax=Oligoflexus sp. TaxID=1971216 RepID=UPI002D80B939
AESHGPSEELMACKKRRRKSLSLTRISICSRGLILRRITSFGKSYSYLRDSGIYSAYNQAFSGTILHGIVDGRLSYSTDEGKTWIKSVVPNTLYPSYASIQAAGSRSLVLTKDKGIYFSNNGGKKYMSWDNTAVDVGTVYRAALDDDKILISASKGIFSIDMASNSTTQIMDSSRFPQFYFDTAVATQNKIFLASSNGIAVSRDGGQNFSLYTTGLNRYDLQFHLFSDAEYYSTYGDLFQIQD